MHSENSGKVYTEATEAIEDFWGDSDTFKETVTLRQQQDQEYFVYFVTLFGQECKGEKNIREGRIDLNKESS